MLVSGCSFKETHFEIKIVNHEERNKDNKIEWYPAPKCATNPAKRIVSDYQTHKVKWNEYKSTIVHVLL